MNKLCTNCNKMLEKETMFYKAGKSYQKFCKKCHNSKRTEYKINNNYIKKKKGFKALDIEMQTKILKIIEDCTKFNTRVNYSRLARDHNIDYSKMIYWKKNKLIF